MSLAQEIGESLRRNPGKVVSRDAEGDFTGGQTLDACRAAAGKLAAVSAGPRIGLLLANCAGYPAALVGTLWSGRVAVPLNPMLKPGELDFLCRDAGG